MTRAAEFDRENEAAWIVSAMLSGLPHRLDVRSSAGKSLECDFEIVLPNGDRVALEVTSSTVAMRAQQVKLIGGGAWACPGIQRNWSVQLDGAGPKSSGARISKFKSEAATYFVTLERECPQGDGDLLNSAFSLGLSPAARTAITELNRLGAHHGTLLERPPYGSPRIALGWTYDDVPHDPSLNEVVEKASMSNQKKLGRHIGVEHHLFIWIDQSDYRNFADLCTFTLPTECAKFPDSIHRVWAGPWLPGINFDGSLQSLISSNGSDPWVSHVAPRVSEYYSRNLQSSTVGLRHLTEGAFPFGNTKR